MKGTWISRGRHGVCVHLLFAKIVLRGQMNIHFDRGISLNRILRNLHVKIAYRFVA